MKLTSLRRRRETKLPLMKNLEPPHLMRRPSFKILKRMSEKLIFKNLETNLAHRKILVFKDGWKMATAL